MASDSAVATRVKTALATDPSVAAQDINVQVVDGIVYLRGSIFTEAERAAAGRVAGAVSGVVAVRNQLTIIPIYRRGAVVEEFIERESEAE